MIALHSWWGLTPFFKKTCDRLADAGFVTLAPDLLSGRRPESEADAALVLRDADINRSADLVLSSVANLQAIDATTVGPVGVIGWSMGASWALWLSAKLPAEVAATCCFYGTQRMDLVGTRAAVQTHFAEDDRFVPDDERVEMLANLNLVDVDVETHQYPGTRHWFFEADRDAYEPGAAELAWDRSVAFLHEHLDAS